jgi:uncharacterized membrane protein
MSDASPTPLLSKHRLEALYDGIYAVAMTLLVLDLKLAQGLAPTSEAELFAELRALEPGFMAWVISFLILAALWIGHQRLFHYVRRVDGRLLWINVLALLLASLLPFSSALIGEHPGHFVSQAFYDANMAALALVTLWQVSHLSAHPELCEPPIPEAPRRASRRLCAGLAALALVSMALAAWNPHIGTSPYLLMFPFARLVRGRDPRAAPAGPPSGRSPP